MFAYATSFNSPVVVDLPVSGGMSQMFANATAFNQPLDHLNAENEGSFDNMFADASAFRGL